MDPIQYWNGINGCYTILRWDQWILGHFDKYWDGVNRSYAIPWQILRWDQWIQYNALANTEMGLIDPIKYLDKYWEGINGCYTIPKQILRWDQWILYHFSKYWDGIYVSYTILRWDHGFHRIPWQKSVWTPAWNSRWRIRTRSGLQLNKSVLYVQEVLSNYQIMHTIYI